MGRQNKAQMLFSRYRIQKVLRAVLVGRIIGSKVGAVFLQGKPRQDIEQIEKMGGAGGTVYKMGAGINHDVRKDQSNHSFVFGRVRKSGAQKFLIISRDCRFGAVICQQLDHAPYHFLVGDRVRHAKEAAPIQRIVAFHRFIVFGERQNPENNLRGTVFNRPVEGNDGKEALIAGNQQHVTLRGTVFVEIGGLGSAELANLLDQRLHPLIVY